MRRLNLNKMISVPLLAYWLLSGNPILADTEEIKTTKGTIEVDSSRIKRKQDNTTYMLKFRAESLPLEEADKIVKNYGFLVSMVTGYDGVNKTSIKNVEGDPGLNFEKSIADYLKNVVGLDLGDPNKIDIHSIHCSIPDYSKSNLEDIISAPEFMIPGGWSIGEINSSERIYIAKDEIEKGNLKNAVIYLENAISYMNTCADADYIRYMTRMMPENNFPKKEMSNSILMLQAQSLLADTYNKLGDDINATLSYIRLKELCSNRERTEFVNTLRKNAEDYLSK